MRSILCAAADGHVARTRIVCFPGAYHAPEDFLAAGFVRSVRTRGLAVDLLFVDAEMAHLGDRSVLASLKTEVVLPARAAGCTTLWFAGISLGGFMAMDYAACNPQDLDGICLLAPYLGNRVLTSEIEQAAGLAAWHAGDAAESDEERRLWRFVQSQPAHSRLVYLGFGRDDRFSRAHRLMADVLAPDAVDVVSGGHDWPTWTALWENFLDARLT